VVSVFVRTVIPAVTLTERSKRSINRLVFNLMGREPREYTARQEANQGLHLDPVVKGELCELAQREALSQLYIRNTLSSKKLKAFRRGQYD